MLTIVPFSQTIAQGPGGVNSGLTMWFKANVGTTGTSISNWTDQSSNTFNITQNNASAQPTLSSEAINFNNSIDFDGNSDYLPIAGKSYNGIGTLNGMSIFVVFKSDYFGGGNNNWAFLDYDRSEFFNFYLKGDGSLGLSYNSGGIIDNTGGTSGFNDNIPHIAVATYDGTSINDTKMYIDGREDYSQNMTGTGSSIGTAQTRFGFIGDGSEANAFDAVRNNTYYDGAIAEVIYYETGNLSATQTRQIQSYLAIKYGITLDNSAGGTSGDYLSSAGTTIWDASLNIGYHNNVAGIGLDNGSILNQRKSRSVAGGLVTMEKSGGFSTTNNFLVWGHDNGSLNATTMGIHPSYNYRLRRVWKSSVTGNPGLVSVSFILGGGIANSGNPSDYALLLDNADTDFSTGAIAHTNGASIIGDTLTFTNVNLSHGTFFTLGTDLKLPSPGNTPDDLTLWLKADSGTSGTAISLWEDASGHDNDAIQSSAATSPTKTSSINYNPSITFNGTSQFLPVSGLNYTATNSIDGMGTFAVFKTSYSGVNYNSNWALLDFDRSEYFNFYVQGNGSLGFSYNASGVADITGTSIGLNNNEQHIGGAIYDNTAINDTRLFSDGLVDFNSDEKPTGINIGTTNTRFGIIGDGSEASSFNGGRNNLYYEGEIAEIILYERGDFTSSELTKIQSYLAIKYGITLNNSGGGTNGDYLSSTGGYTIWDASIQPGYHNNIIGIGRDDNQDLLQKQSRTIDDTTHIYLSTLANSNASNTGLFSEDETFILMGADLGKMCATTASNLEKPIGVYSRIEREWKVTNTGFVGQISVDWVLNSCANTPSISTADLRLLVDDDGDFTDASIFDTSNGLTFSISGDTVSIAGIVGTMIPKDVTRYITLASINIATPLPIELINFEAHSINDNFVEINWETASERENDFFTIEKSRNGKDWNFVQEVSGAGNSSTLIAYKTHDYSPYHGTSYYRLKQTDFNGKSSYSNVDLVNLIQNNSILLFPNPTNGKLTIQSTENIVTISILDCLGKETILPVDVSNLDISFLDAGKYILRISTNKNTYYEKIVLTK
ncbi:MAG: T9SS type A sorting domain-containing protein [Crocinitomicaceae bacterium]|nr:T9SS type A sorting domain-containing protein [Crocinitomicaceae bacterium]